MERLSTIRRDFKSPARTARPRSLSLHRHHLLTLAGVILGAGIIVGLLPHSAEATRSEPEILLDPAVSLPFPEAPDADLAETDVLPPHAGPDEPQQQAADATSKAQPDDWLRVSVRKGDNMSLIFGRQGLTGRELHEVMSLGGDTQALKRIYPGSEIRLLLDADGRLHALSYDIGEARTLHIERKDGRFTASTVERALETRVAQASGTIRDSLFMAANRAGLSDGLIMEMVRIFGWDIDFSLDIRQDDRFSVVYEEVYLEGDKLRDGRILAAEFVNRDKVFRAVRYTDAQGRADYYSPDGKSMRKAFLRSPVDYTRVSSRFSTGRMHPVLNRIRAHKGVDYAAPTGTPVRSTGDGRVLSKGPNGGYGNTVIIQHGSRYSTLYAHLSGFARGLKQGDRVSQGQIIGYVGSTGLATGPHLHYEFRVDEVHRDPLKVQFPNAAPVGEKHMADFLDRARPLLAQLDALQAVHASAAVADGDPDQVALSSVR